jgi:hypothetical protein
LKYGDGSPTKKEEDKMKIQTITIQWTNERDLEKSVSHTFTAFTGDLSDFEICEIIFSETNLYSGKVFWDYFISPALSTVASERNHTALSVGDFITINDGFSDSKIYRCEDIGFEQLVEAL